jgi:uncharacterized protein (DUF924 family)
MFVLVVGRCCKASLRLLPIFHRSFASNMASAYDKYVEEIIHYWFKPDHAPWFGAGEAVVQEMREKYGDLVVAAGEGKLDSWKDEPRASLALILLCDQMCRSLNKGTKKLNYLDPIALEVAYKFIEQKSHNHLDFTFFQRAFIYLPFEHSESRADQEVSVKVFAQLLEDAKTPEEKKAGEGFLKFAKDHKEVIDRFGRYPTRNAPLERENTPEEAEFLANMPSKYKW